MHEMRSKQPTRPLAALFAALLCFSLCLTPCWAQESERTLIPVGKAVGIKLFADGVLVVDVSEVEQDGRSVSPAADCGLQEGDLILRANEEKIQSTEHLQSILQENGEAPMEVEIRRGDELFTTQIAPVQCSDGVCRLGAWIRDSMAGIGTMTYYDPVTGSYGALGHGITDVDTARLMPLASGSIMETTVKAVKKGEEGSPGELKGDFSVQHDVGTLWANTQSGIFGTMSDTDAAPTGKAYPLADADDIHVGQATILTTVSGDETEEYTVKILRLYDQDQPTRNLLLEVTDQRLLDITGGIVQGMSGSPILQDGKLVGAVTHVLVNDPTKGYGITIENMLQAAE